VEEESGRLVASPTVANHPRDDPARDSVRSLSSADRARPRDASEGAMRA
jgi:hypothetical protein